MNMKSLYFTGLLTVFFLTAGFAEAATANLSLKNDAMVAIINGKEVVMTEQEHDGLFPVKGADLRVVSVSETLAKRIDVKAGFYFFDASGAFVAVLPHDFASGYLGAELSPNQKTLALNVGGSLVCTVSFYTWPDLKALAQPSTKEVPFLYPTENAPAMLWISDTAVLFNIMTPTKRECNYDPCGVSSVVLYDLKNKKLIPIQKGTDLCDYSIASYSKNTISLNKSCKPTVEDWKSFENQLCEKITLPLPPM